MAKTKRPEKDTASDDALDLGVEEEQTSVPVREEGNVDIEKMLDDAENEDELVAQVEKGPEPGSDMPAEAKLESGVEWVVFDWGGNDIYFPKRKEYVFGAVASRYRLQLVAQRDKIEDGTGQIIPGRNIAAQFSDSIYVTKNEAIARLIYRSKSFQAGLLWDVMSMAAQAKEANFNALKKLVGNDPGAEQRLFEELRAKYENAKAAAA
jgi:hypothetical protein